LRFAGLQLEGKQPEQLRLTQVQVFVEPPSGKPTDPKPQDKVQSMLRDLLDAGGCIKTLTR
jgi:hypothetical protein